MKGQNPLILLTLVGVIFVIIGGLILAFTIMSPNMIGIGLIIVGALIIAIGTRFSG
jgi:hypothetical protein